MAGCWIVSKQQKKFYSIRQSIESAVADSDIFGGIGSISGTGIYNSKSYRCILIEFPEEVIKETDFNTCAFNSIQCSA